MIILSFFEIPYGERLAKNVNKRYVQVIPRSTAQQPKTRSAVVMHYYALSTMLPVNGLILQNWASLLKIL